MHRLVKELFERVEKAGKSENHIARNSKIARSTIGSWRLRGDNPRIDTLDDAGTALGGKLVWVWDDD